MKEGNLVSVIDTKDISANELEKLYLQTVWDFRMNTDFVYEKVVVFPVDSKSRFAFSRRGYFSASNSAQRNLWPKNKRKYHGKRSDG